LFFFLQGKGFGKPVDTLASVLLLALCACLLLVASAPLHYHQAKMAALRVVTVPILEDNYAYLLIDCASKCAAAVDPADAKIVVAAASREGVKLTHVLTTHGHWDHAGGNNDMVFLPHVLFPLS
jgi:glyoxylase-like metal-dependent hydrolase (beta-lactamase superfamily II)